MKTIQLDMYQATAVAALVLLLGRVLVSKIAVLRKYCIPAPVVGGFLYAIVHTIVRGMGILEIQSDMTLKNVFMVAFFCSVGFTASFKMLKKGGIQTIVFLALASVMCIIQNVAGAGLEPAHGARDGLHPDGRRTRYRRFLRTASLELRRSKRRGSCYCIRNLWSGSRLCDWRTDCNCKDQKV